MSDHCGPARFDVVVVGASVAGVRTVEALRRAKFAGTVLLIDAEPEAPYDRTALSKQVLTAGAELDAIRLRSAAQLDALDVTLWRGRRAIALEPDRHLVELDGGEAVTYGRLVIASGAAARSLPTPVPTAAEGVLKLRSYDDAVALRSGLDQAQHLVVVGGGFIGAEVAAAARYRELAVTIVEPLAAPMSRGLGEEIGQRLAALHESHGVRLATRRTVADFLVAGRVSRVVLDDGRDLPADLVVVGIGVVPSVGWLDGTGLASADGVGCDEYCRAGAPGIYAVGDVARWHNPLFDESMRIEHWTNAIEQATTVGWNIAHPDELRAYAPVPYVWSDQYGQRIQVVGRPRPDAEIHVVAEGTADGAVVAVYLAENRLIGAFALNASSSALHYRRLIAARASASEALAAPAGSGPH